MEKTVNFDLTGKVAIVTGGSRGLGVELATSMAEYGADIALMAGNVEKMKKVAADIAEKTGRKVIWVKVNIGEHGGKIVNINSVNSFSASPVAPVYHVAKAAEAALTQSCAAAWAGQGIYVNGIAPGNMQNGEMAPDTPADILENIRRKVPQRRLGGYGDLSGALLYLVSDANTYTQGVTITCDGGLILEAF